MSKRSDLQTIDKAFYALDRALESGCDFQTYYNQNIAEERAHRRFVSGSPRGLSGPQAARLFCVRQIAGYLNGDKAPDVKDIFFVRLGVYQAYALVENNRDKVTTALKSFDLAQLIGFDYAELVKAA